MSDDAIETIALGITGGMLLGMAKALTSNGMSAGTALRLTSAVLLVEAFGEDVLRELGMSTATFYRWRAAMKGMEVPDEPPAELIGAVQRLYLGQHGTEAPNGS